MKSSKYLVAALCAGMACVMLQARAADNAEKKDLAQPVKAVKVATPATPAAPGTALKSGKQGVADRHAKATETASNLLKKSSDTSDSVIKNTK